MKKFIQSLIFFLATVTTVTAQQGTTLKGNVKDPAGQPVEAATITLLESNSKKLIKIGTTDKAGNFEIIQLPAAAILVQVSAIGFESFNSNEVKLGDNAIVELPPVQLKAAEKNLQGVTVTARKPMVATIWAASAASCSARNCTCRGVPVEPDVTFKWHIPGFNNAGDGGGTPEPSSAISTVPSRQVRRTATMSPIPRAGAWSSGGLGGAWAARSRSAANDHSRPEATSRTASSPPRVAATASQC